VKAAHRLWQGSGGSSHADRRPRRGTTDPDRTYGFVADSLHGDYEPLDESGLVVADPEEQPF